MPVRAGIDQADGLAILDHVGDDQDLRMPGQVEAVQHVHLQRTEAAAEVDVLLRRDALVAEHHHPMLDQGAADARQLLRRDRQVQVQADDFAPSGASKGRISNCCCVCCVRSSVASDMGTPVWRCQPGACPAGQAALHSPATPEQGRRIHILMRQTR
jgi:hypothetical protein